jgi:hypothetical protein
MTRQNSRPEKKKHHKTRQKVESQQTSTTSLVATIVNPFTPSLQLKAELLERRRQKNGPKKSKKPKPGSIFASGRCKVGCHNRSDIYTVRIRNKVSAEKILRVPSGIKIRLTDAKFVNSYGNNRYKDVSARSFEVIQSPSNTDSSPSTNCTHGKSIAPSKVWAIYPDGTGVKHRNGVTVFRPLLIIPEK